MSAQSSSDCRSCRSANSSTFTGEIAIHFPGLEGLDRPIVWVFPKLQVCLNCGFTEFAIPEGELRRLVESDTTAALRAAREMASSLESGGHLCIPGFGRVPPLNSTTDKIITAKDRFHSSKEFTHGISVQHVPLCSGTKSCPYHVCVAVVT